MEGESGEEESCGGKEDEVANIQKIADTEGKLRSEGK